MTLLVLIISTLTAGSTSAASTVDSSTEPALKLTPARELCKSARRAVVFFRARVWAWQQKRADGRADRTPLARGHSCHWARYALDVHRARARTARRSFYAWRERMKIPAEAICFVFRAYCSQAIAVAKCESGPSMTPRAHNGQYLGTFQMGSSERQLFGHGNSVLEQARAAYLYFVRSGRDWSPWSCRWAAS